MINSKIDKVFAKTFEKHYPVGNEYLEIVERYVVHGLHPGGMFERIFANNVLMAACCSHRKNDWNQIQHLMRWIVHIAPPGCWGSYENTTSWCSMDANKRRKILEDMRLVSTLFDVIKEA